MNHENNKLLLKKFGNIFNLMYLMKRHVCWLCGLLADDLLCKQLRKRRSRIGNLVIRRETSGVSLKQRL